MNTVLNFFFTFNRLTKNPKTIAPKNPKPHIGNKIKSRASFA